MGKYIIRVDVNGKELAKILDELEKAKETIYKCYCELQDLKAITIQEKSNAASED